MEGNTNFQVDQADHLRHGATNVQKTVRQRTKPLIAFRHETMPVHLWRLFQVTIHSTYQTRSTSLCVIQRQQSELSQT